MISADLHTHSTASDGVFAPAQIVEQAADLGLSAIAVTDHDSVDGAKGALAANQHSVMIIPGVELSTVYDGRNVHMLGYFYDVDSKVLPDVLEERRTIRKNRVLRMVDNLAEDGFDISAEELISSGKTMNRLLLARTLVDKGYATSVDDAFKRLIGYKSKYYVECKLMNTLEALSLVREAEGLAFIAHPAQYRVVDLISKFQSEGMFGVEAFHTMHSQAERDMLCKLAEENGLAVSGGSDWHGDDTHNAQLASAGLSAQQFQAFLQACNRI